MRILFILLLFLSITTKAQIFTDTIRLSSSQLFNAQFSPPTIIASPGANKYIMVLQVTALCDAGSTPFTGVGSNYGVLRYAAGTTITTPFWNSVTATHDMFTQTNVFTAPYSNGIAINYYGIVNQPIQFKGTSKPAGIGDNELKIYITYVIVSL